MPIIFEYFGIKILFWSLEHDPIHVHAFYGTRFGMRVEFVLKGNKVVKREIKGLKGYHHFPPAQMRDLKKLLDKHQDDMAEKWITFVIRNIPVKRTVITRRIK